MIDSISDMLTRIRNAQKARHDFVLMSFSNVKMAIAKVLKSEGFVLDVVKEKSEDNEKFENIKIILKYKQLSSTKSEPIIESIRQVSKQGQRRYVRKNDINKVKNGYGISVVSTSQGVMSGKDARKRGLGGELICEVW
ncbi:MAG: 30S ribosomal protein S8 [Candidatus Moranbacteria bacterium]|nr:30S ribosomal protein S8 [Candidatus Moranbacteria bacterium]